MPITVVGKKWPEDARAFEVSVTHHPTRGSQTYLPEPIMEKLGYPDKVIFVMRGNIIEMKVA